MKVLYIGGTGEISYECALRSVAVGHEVTVFNRGRSDEPLPDSIRRITGEVGDTTYVRLDEERFDVVCQFLAFDADAVRRDAEVFGGACGQYVFISTASAYQKPPPSYVVTEDVPLSNPYWPYSAAKAEAERVLLDLHARSELPVTIVRPSHTYRRRFPGGIARGDDWAWRMLNDRPVIAFGDGTSLWTLTHSRDFAIPFVNLLGNDAALGEAFHITRHMNAHTWNEILTEAAAALGVEADIVHVPTDTLVRYDPDNAGPLLGDKTWPVLFDNSKVMSVAGEFDCEISLPEGMRGSAEHYFRYRADAYEPDARLHALLDRICDEQRALGA